MDMKTLYKHTYHVLDALTGGLSEFMSKADNYLEYELVKGKGVSFKRVETDRIAVQVYKEENDQRVEGVLCIITIDHKNRSAELLSLKQTPDKEPAYEFSESADPEEEGKSVFNIFLLYWLTDMTKYYNVQKILKDRK